MAAFGKFAARGGLSGVSEDIRSTWSEKYGRLFRAYPSSEANECGPHVAWDKGRELAVAVAEDVEQEREL